MYKLLVKPAVLALLLVGGHAQADVLKIPVGQQGGELSRDLPQRGQSQASVLRRHGEPARRHASVGQPPITRWDYPGFTVYFEYSHVINSVRQHQRQQQ